MWENSWLGEEKRIDLRGLGVERMDLGLEVRWWDERLDHPQSIPYPPSTPLSQPHLTPPPYCAETQKQVNERENERED